MNDIPADKQPLEIDNVDVSHLRLVDLAALADQAKPFFDWVEDAFRRFLNTLDTLDTILRNATREQIQAAIAYCYGGAETAALPLLFDGIGRSYGHAQACYYFFSWIVRDAPQQRLGPLIARIARSSRRRRSDIEPQVLSALIVKYRENLKTFNWDAVREVFIDRLEGSRRSIRGREKEVVARTALLFAVQNFYSQHEAYGIYSQVVLAEGQIAVGNETFDVSAKLMNADGHTVRRVLMPVKTRETEGGGHAHLFTRDITSAMSTTKKLAPEDFLVVVIVARNWSAREAETVRELSDHAVIFDLDPNRFVDLGDAEQQRLNRFVEQVLLGEIEPKDTG